MGKKSDIKTCRYKFCKHESKEIDISCEDYKRVGSMYYHRDCYKAKADGEWKNEKTKADLQLIRNLWLENISKTVIYSQLFSTMNSFLERGIESEYLVFVLQYCIDHKFKLNYPGGFKYYVDKQEIKDAYARKKKSEIKISDKAFTAKDKDNSPTFSVNTKQSGFGSILKNNQRR